MISSSFIFMAKSVTFVLNGFNRVLYRRTLYTGYVKPFSSSTLTQQEVAAALRPFYFAVHPDLLWQFPEEKEINENSLKLLNSYLETLLKNQPASPTSVTFCLRNAKSKANSDPSFKKVQIKLSIDLRDTIREILSTCQISSQYSEALSKKVPPQKENSESTPKEPSNGYDQGQDWWKEVQGQAEDIEIRIKKEPVTDFRLWLNENASEAHSRLQACQPVREETERLCNELKQSLQLRDVIWNCGWGITHFRGCLKSFCALTVQHPQDMTVLKDRTIVFGHQTGVSFEGHIILSSEDVRNNWLDMINSVHKYDSLLQELPNAEKALSDVLRGIVVDHRKFQPTVMVQKYIQQLGKLRAALYKYKWQHGYPDTWPLRLENFQIVVECEAGPLMLSPTGQFIVPASCPAFLLVEFISKNMTTADHLRQQYIEMKQKEDSVYTMCMSVLGLKALEKDDNVTPDLMVRCCERLLEQASLFSRLLRDMRLRISHYYLILQDGDICIPWNWEKPSS